MSVAAERSHSPTHFGSKRHFERSDSADYLHSTRGSKRARQHSHSPSGWKEESNQGASSSRESALAALRSLFPGMEEKVLADILDSCGDNLDAAIKRLGQLQLTAQCNAEAQEGAGVVAAPEDGTSSKAGHSGEVEANGHSQATNTDGSQQSNGGAGPRNSEEWVEALVQQMASAKDVDDARKRASHLLQAFEQAVLQAATPQGSGASDLASLRNHLAELSRDNGILKRAVAIQNTRMQEAIASKDAEVASLRSVLVEYEQKIRALELSNYSLSMHLRQAIESNRGFDTGQRPPDVY